MGYSYGYNPRTGYLVLSCDNCGAVNGKVVRVQCPFGYCQAAALCSDCRKSTGWGTKANHREMGCEEGHNAYQAEKQERADLMAAGKFLRVSALGNWNKAGDMVRVHVIFQGQNGAEKGYYMTKETYDAFPLTENVTVEQYESVGTLIPASTEFSYDPVE